MNLGCTRKSWYGWEYLPARCPAEHTALRESVKHNGCCRITTLCLLNNICVRADEHGSYIKSSVQLTSVEPELTEVGQWWPHHGHLQLTMKDFVCFSSPSTRTLRTKKIITYINGLRCAPHIVSGYYLTHLTYCWSLPAPDQVHHYSTQHRSFTSDPCNFIFQPSNCSIVPCSIETCKCTSDKWSGPLCTCQFQSPVWYAKLWKSNASQLQGLAYLLWSHQFLCTCVLGWLLSQWGSCQGLSVKVKVSIWSVRYSLQI